MKNAKYFTAKFITLIIVYNILYTIICIYFVIFLSYPLYQKNKGDKIMKDTKLIPQIMNIWNCLMYMKQLQAKA